MPVKRVDSIKKYKKGFGIDVVVQANMLGVNFIFHSFKLTIIHYHTQKQWIHNIQMPNSEK